MVPLMRSGTLWKNVLIVAGAMVLTEGVVVGNTISVLLHDSSASVVTALEWGGIGALAFLGLIGLFSVRRLREGLERLGSVVLVACVAIGAVTAAPGAKVPRVAWSFASGFVTAMNVTLVAVILVRRHSGQR